MFLRHSRHSRPISTSSPRVVTRRQIESRTMWPSDRRDAERTRPLASDPSRPSRLPPNPSESFGWIGWEDVRSGLEMSGRLWDSPLSTPRRKQTVARPTHLSAMLITVWEDDTSQRPLKQSKYEYRAAACGNSVITPGPAHNFSCKTWFCSEAVDPAYEIRLLPFESIWDMFKKITPVVASVRRVWWFWRCSLIF